MKEVKVMPKFKCDFCKKRGIKRVMASHEQTCYRNPQRVCYACKNTGQVEVHYGDDHDTTGMENCKACEKFDEEMIKRIEHYEKTGEMNYEEEKKLPTNGIPF